MADKTDKTTKPSDAPAGDELALAQQRVTELEATLARTTADRDAIGDQLKTVQGRVEALSQRPEVRVLAALERLGDVTEANALLVLSTRAHTAGKGRVAEESLARALKLLNPEG